MLERLIHYFRSHEGVRFALATTLPMTSSPVFRAANNALNLSIEERLPESAGHNFGRTLGAYPGSSVIQ
ncbi:hypothetical protein AWB64_02592 [Caballeronia sordidicola]|uniref:Uncharacterized protein n=1 Tax=Caballeronia sordidicola TaxID=196367 RepID=A0A158GCS6_CABSO|nr:hypothetical protein AWB64_02592 [Caballeronia sordidicola]